LRLLSRREDALATLSPAFFASAAQFRRWLEANHRAAGELWVAFHKAHAGRKGLTYREAVDEALCFGWIDGLKKRLDEGAYLHRFTPRRPRSIWSDVNTRNAGRLKRQGRMAPAGLEAFAARDPARAGLYSFEDRRRAAFDAPALARFKARKRAWAFFEAQPPGYRRTATFWVMSAKRAATRARSLGRLIADSSRGLRLDVLSGNGMRRGGEEA